MQVLWLVALGSHARAAPITAHVLGKPRGPDCPSGRYAHLDLSSLAAPSSGPSSSSSFGELPTSFPRICSDCPRGKYVTLSIVLLLLVQLHRAIMMPYLLTRAVVLLHTTRSQQVSTLPCPGVLQPLPRRTVRA